MEAAKKDAPAGYKQQSDRYMEEISK